MLFHIYYASQENGEYLRHVINSSGAGIVGEADTLTHLTAPGGKKADVVLLEYQEGNPQLDHWIEEAAANPRGPAIFLYIQEWSTNKLWKALLLGVKECFTFPIKGEDFQEAVQRLMAWATVPLGMGKAATAIDRVRSAA